MLLDQIALGTKQPYNVAEHVKITLNTNDRSPCTISNADPALNTLALGCPDYGAILARRMSYHVVRNVIDFFKLYAMTALVC